jgi:adenylate cyclase
MGAKTQTTVLFAEVSGGAEVLEAAGSIAGTYAISDCIDRIRKAAERSGGKFVRVIGNEVMLLFETPDGAAGAATKLHATVNALPPVAGTKLAVQVGFHSGPVYQSGDDVLGDTVKLAAALVHQAQRGQTITSHQTAQLLGTSFRASPTQLVTVPLPQNPQDALDEISPQRGLRAYMPRATTTLHLKYGSDVVICWRENEAVVIGRDRGCGLVIHNGLASRRHCTIQLRPEGFALRDHSSNGTYVTNEGSEEVLVWGNESPLAAHGWLSFGNSRRLATVVLEFFGQ